MFQCVMQDLVGQDTDFKVEHLARLWRNDSVDGLAWKPPTPGDLKGSLNTDVDRDVDNEARKRILAERNRPED